MKILFKLALLLFFSIFSLNNSYSDHSTCKKAHNHLKNLQKKCTYRGCVDAHQTWINVVMSLYSESEQSKRESGYHDIGGACTGFLTYKQW